MFCLFICFSQADKRLVIILINRLRYFQWKNLEYGNCTQNTFTNTTQVLDGAAKYFTKHQSQYHLGWIFYLQTSLTNIVFLIQCFRVLLIDQTLGCRDSLVLLYRVFNINHKPAEFTPC